MISKDFFKDFSEAMEGLKDLVDAIESDMTNCKTDEKCKCKDECKAEGKVEGKQATKNEETPKPQPKTAKKIVTIAYDPERPSDIEIVGLKSMSAPEAADASLACAKAVATLIEPDSDRKANMLFNAISDAVVDCIMDFAIERMRKSRKKVFE